MTRKSVNRPLNRRDPYSIWWHGMRWVEQARRRRVQSQMARVQRRAARRQRGAAA